MLMTDEGWCEKNRNMFRKLLNRDLIKNCECNDPDIVTKFRMQLLVIYITKGNVGWPRQNFSLQCQYNINHISDENKEKYQFGDNYLIQY